MRVAIFGAGIAGLSVARALQGRIAHLDIFELESEPGGLARSFKWHGFDCDIAPHRLYPGTVAVRDELRLLVPMHKVTRRSKILLRDRWFRDPVNALELIGKLFPNPGFKIISSYLSRPNLAEETFESLVLKQYGSALHDLFFAPYSEKLFGIPADQISPVWGRNKLRVGGLRELIRRKSKLYFRSFLYPNKGGYGAFAHRFFEEVRSDVHLDSRVVGLSCDQSGDLPVYRCVVENQGRQCEAAYDVIVSTLPAPILVEMLGGRTDLTYRKAILSYLALNKSQMSPNHWLYFADRDRMLNRVAEFKHFMISGEKPEGSVICCETTDLGDYAFERVIDELCRVNLIQKSEVVDTLEIPVSHAYPIYDLGYESDTENMRSFLSAKSGLFILGRHATFEHREVDEIYGDAKELAERIVRYRYSNYE